MTTFLTILIVSNIVQWILILCLIKHARTTVVEISDLLEIIKYHDKHVDKFNNQIPLIRERLNRCIEVCNTYLEDKKQWLRQQKT